MAGGGQRIYQVQKGKLIERIAELINAKKVPIPQDVRDESAEDLRIVLEPRARTVDPAVLMEMLFRNSDLETRFAMNMNVLIDGRTPQVCSLREVLRAFSTTGARFCCGGRGSGWTRSTRGWSAGRLPDRLSQSRPGDPDHPHRG